jgi:hypothetical protein
LIFSGSVFSQKSLPDTAIAVFTPNEIKLDGILDEKEWNNAIKITNFHQRETVEGAPITEKTELAILYNKHKMWIGIWCWDSKPNELVMKEMVRDFYYWRDDNFEIIFDTYLDKRNGYVFVINPNGAMADVQITNEGNGFNRDWNAVWDAQTNITKDGWFAEIEIPFSSLKFPNVEEQVWGVNFERNIRRNQEQAFWQGWSRNYDFEHVSHAGTLVGLKNINSKELLELKPFATAGIQKEESKELQQIYKIGGDANVFITPSVKLNLTYNTDFAQVESDQLQYNITRFNIFYPEKREIFLEGKDFFEYNIDGNAKTFYSRRIGINDNGYEKPILAGLKLTGIQDRTSIGVMSFQDKSDSTNPSSNFSIIRIKQSIFEKSSIGMILTSLNNSNHNNFVYGLDFNYATSKLFGDKNFQIGGFFSESIDKDKKSNDFAYSIVTSFRNDAISSGINFSNIKDNYNPEIGFLRRKNYKQLSYDFSYKYRVSDGGLFQYLIISPVNASFYLTDTTNRAESMAFTSTPLSFLTKTGDLISFVFKREFDRADEPISSIQRPIGEYWYGMYGFEITTFEGRWWMCDMGYFKGSYYGCLGSDSYLGLRFNINKHLAINLNYAHTDIDFKDFYIEKNYFSLNTELGITPKLFTKIYAQWLNITNEMILNYRLHWNPVPGSDFFLVLNQNYSTLNKEVSLLNTTVTAKIIWRLPVGF